MDVQTSVAEFFQGAVTEALRKQHVDATEPTEFYLVNLLVDFTKARATDDQPLALRLAQLASATPENRARGLKEIGDTSLYVSGFFADSLTRKLVDVDYYVAIGGSAYGQLANLVSTSRAPGPSRLRETYAELARKFAGFVEVLGAIRRNLNFGSGNLLALYEAWVRTGSEWLAKRLHDSGLIPAEALLAGKSNN